MSVEPLKSMFVPSNHGLLREFHNEDSETAAESRPFISGIYNMFPGLETGETEASGFISDSDSLLLTLAESFDMSFNEHDLKLGDLRKVCLSGVEGGDEYSLTGLVTVDPVGVGGSTLMIGMNEGDSISLAAPLDVKVKCVSGSRLWSSSSSVAVVS